MRSLAALFGLSSLLLIAAAGCGSADGGSDATDQSEDSVVACPMIACPAGQVRDPATCECGPKQCVDNQLCVIGDHWDSTLCKCVPNQCVVAPCAVTSHWDSTLCKCVPNQCVQTQLCILGEHWDSTLCKCVPSSGTCGGVTCASGEYCCNASCGICAPPGGICPQIICN